MVLWIWYRGYGIVDMVSWIWYRGYDVVGVVFGLMFGCDTVGVILARQYGDFYEHIYMHYL